MALKRHFTSTVRCLLLVVSIERSLLAPSKPSVNVKMLTIYPCAVWSHQESDIASRIFRRPHSFVKSSPILYLSVASIDDAYVQLENVGVTFIDEPHCVAKMDTTETWMSFFRDSEGNVLVLLSEVSS